LFATQVAQKKNLEKIPKKESEEKIHPACLFTKAAHIPPPHSSIPENLDSIYFDALFIFFYATKLGRDFFLFREDWKKLVHTFRGIFSFCSLFVMKAELGSKSCDHNLALSTDCHSPFSVSQFSPPHSTAHINRWGYLLTNTAPKTNKKKWKKKENRKRK